MSYVVLRPLRIRILAVGLLALSACRVGSEAPIDLPDSIGAVGDSITQAANADRSSIGPSNPHLSWSTGSDGRDDILSHYERLLEVDDAIRGSTTNAAVAGAKVADARGQADKVVAAGASYVTILLGANDLCASSAGDMTSVADYEDDFRAALQTLNSGLPNAKILAVSVPDVAQLWELFRDHPRARAVWRTFDVCPSVLGEDAEQDRAAVRRRNVEFNRALAEVCAEFATCRYDGGKVFGYQFTRDDVSDVDYFHPSKTGLARLADLAWEAGYWPDLSR